MAESESKSSLIEPIASKPELAVPPLDSVGGWNRTLLRAIQQSGHFSVTTCPFPTVRAGRRWYCLNLMRVNGHLVLLDTWDRSVALHQAMKAGAFQEQFAEVKLVIRINKSLRDKFLPVFTAQTGIPVTAWSMFPDCKFPLECFRWQAANHSQLANLTGANSRCGRPRWIAAAKEVGNFYIASTRESHDAYARNLQQCRWGVCLAGVGDKTRREPEFLSCGMPLAMNYRPHYPFPFEPGVHFYFMRRPSDLSKLSSVDPAPYARRSNELWKRYFSPYGISSLLSQLVTEFCS